MKCPDCGAEMKNGSEVTDCSIPSETVKVWSCPNCMELVIEEVKK